MSPRLGLDLAPASRARARRASPVTQEFFEGSTVEVARRLIGILLVHETEEGRVSGTIQETEAYLSEGDPASHSHRGRTQRNDSMFLAPGHAYVYRIYGLHHCFNVVTAPEGVGEAVLIRSLVPEEGLELMAKRRGRSARADLCSGPAKLVQALAIGPRHDGRRLVAPGEGLGGGLGLAGPGLASLGRGDIPLQATPRIGIAKAADLALRFLPADADVRA